LPAERYSKGNDRRINLIQYVYLSDEIDILCAGAELMCPGQTADGRNEPLKYCDSFLQNHFAICSNSLQVAAV